MMGIFAGRLSAFVLSIAYIDTSVQKAGVSGFQGFVEHSAMIWHMTQSADSRRRDLSVIWLDLAKLYGSVPHPLIKYFLKFFGVPEKLQLYLLQYYDTFLMRSTVKSNTTGWQKLEVGIPIGSKVSPFLFAMAMEVMMRSVKECSRGVESETNHILPPIHAFI